MCYHAGRQNIPNPNSICSAEHWSVKSSQFDGRSATHRHVPECVVCCCSYTLIFPHPPPAQLVLTFASATKSLPRFTSQTQFENEITFIAHALMPSKLFIQIHSMSSNSVNLHPSVSNSVHSLKFIHSTSTSLATAWSTQGYLTPCCHLVLDSQVWTPEYGDLT